MKTETEMESLAAAIDDVVANANGRESISFLMSELRDAGWRGLPSAVGNFEPVLEQMGFRIEREYSKRNPRSVVRTFVLPRRGPVVKSKTETTTGRDPLSPFERRMVNDLVDLIWKADEEFRARDDARRADANRKLAARMSDDAAIREEVIEALVAKGVSRRVAADRTNTTAKMLAEGRALGIV